MGGPPEKGPHRDLVKKVFVLQSGVPPVEGRSPHPVNRKFLDEADGVEGPPSQEDPNLTCR